MGGQSYDAQILIQNREEELIRQNRAAQHQRHWEAQAQLLLQNQTVGGGGSDTPPPPGGASECASVSHKLCVECGKMLDSNTGYVNAKSQRTGKLYLNSACRPCHNHRVRVVAKLKLKHPRPPAGTPCECCGRVSKLFLDHSHDTDAFRGWICRECNSSIGLMGDSIEGVRKALTYLETRSTQ